MGDQSIGVDPRPITAILLYSLLGIAASLQEY